jgi:ABC-type protease/lipase transport system fused ATPase/permease subunit
MAICFVLLLLHLWMGFCFALGGIVLVLLAWHGEEPQESEA